MGLFTMVGMEEIPEDIMVIRTKELLDIIDVDGDGEITKDEFIKNAMTCDFVCDMMQIGALDEFEDLRDNDAEKLSTNEEPSIVYLPVRPKIPVPESKAVQNGADNPGFLNDEAKIPSIDKVNIETKPSDPTNDSTKLGGHPSSNNQSNPLNIKKDLNKLAEKSTSNSVPVVEKVDPNDLFFCCAICNLSLI